MAFPHKAALPDAFSKNHVHIAGQGTRSIVFGHGFGCDQIFWRHISPAFEEHYRVITFDFDDCSRPPTPTERASTTPLLEEYAETLAGICEHLGVEDALYVGHSIGAMIGARAVLHHPRLFSAMALICPCAVFVNDDTYTAGFHRRDIDELMTMMEVDFIGWAYTVGPLIMGNADRPQLGRELAECMAEMDPEAGRRFARAAFYDDSRHLLPQLTLPSLVIHSSDDPIVSAAAANHVAELLRSRIVFVEDTGHCPQLSNPSDTAQELRHFFDAQQ